MKKCGIILFIFICSLSTTYITQAQTPYVNWEYNFPQPGIFENGVNGLALLNDNLVVYTGAISPESSGTCFSKIEYPDIWLGEFDNSQNFKFNFCFMKDSSGGDGITILPESDSMVNILGFTYSDSLFGAYNHSVNGDDIFLFEVGTNGSPLKARMYGSPGQEIFSSAMQTRDGGIIVGGTSNDTGGDIKLNYAVINDGATSCPWIFKLDSLGNIQWSDILGGTGNQGLPSVIQGNDGYYYVCFATNSTDGNLTGLNYFGGFDSYVAKLDSVGEIKWEYTYGGTGDDGATDIIQLKNGKILFSGITNSPANSGNATDTLYGNQDIWVVELDTSGKIIWHKDYGLANDEIFVDGCSTTLQLSDGTVVVASSLNGSDIYIVRIDTSDGNLLWSYYISGGTGTSVNTDISDVIALNDDAILLSGSSTAISGVLGDSVSIGDGFIYHSFLLELSDITGIAPVPIPQGYYNLSVYPNPFSQSANIKLDGGNIQHWQFILQDLLGRTVAEYNNEGQVSLTIPRNNLPSGLYIGIARDDEGSMLGKTKIVVQ